MQLPDAPTSRTPVQACFGAGTLVHTRNGQVPIELIQAGDFVLGQPEAGGELAHKRVVNTAAYESREVCLVQYLLADEASPRSLMVTGNHPFWVQDEGWLPARDLKTGCGLQLLGDVEAYVTGISPVLVAPDSGPGGCSPGDERPGNPPASNDGRSPRTRVFNLEIEDCHTYFVGEAGVWVHNERFETSSLQAPCRDGAPRMR